MSFLDSDIDLVGTRFSQETLQFVRDYWCLLVENVAPEWLENPKGSLAVHWKSNTTPSATHLISLAGVLYFFVKETTYASQPIFRAKLRQLLFSEGMQHEEQVTELIAGLILARLSSPVSVYRD